MSNDIRLIVGLANPGQEYSRTRHNAGAWFINELAKWHNTQLREEAKYFGYTARIAIAGQDVRLLIPTTFMNLSGKSVSALAKFYRIDVTQILVVHDELDLPPGVAKFKQGGSHGGHNGLKDIISKMANSKEFYRLRIGIGHPGHKDKVTSYVLGKAQAKEQEQMDAAIDEAVRCIDILAKDGMTKAMSRLHTFKAQ
ncbi:aminoacyl-tRNA hydrolase [Moritella viscosa]|uniref:Peptidyl-tRNA hydrolase n=1 Tax=Moritella viscosa TaxID=80854 RepID=A0A090IHJ9_9GAMM|nr:aminoacyl-tRNA hydrolase [Moritella viscosa]CED61776.1 peptidyl-tRNA hydrolase [Moritella viscosa]SGY90761.1 Peptidyl-tRNA hydrolase [Moritella viscosa]SGY94826.1 Peptidyl-tRNA hydrolase [Moritella viscosa]SGY95219.1 Peptidyl-tRNA hydrolase [Moritella viscosa]SGY99662.1 Peptidyl-tRNA hydrolase [Moritella viscosa]